METPTTAPLLSLLLLLVMFCNKSIVPAHLIKFRTPKNRSNLPLVRLPITQKTPLRRSPQKREGKRTPLCVVMRAALTPDSPTQSGSIALRQGIDSKMPKAMRHIFLTSKTLRKTPSKSGFAKGSPTTSNATSLTVTILAPKRLSESTGARYTPTHHPFVLQKREPE